MLIRSLVLFLSLGLVFPEAAHALRVLQPHQDYKVTQALTAGLEETAFLEEGHLGGEDWRDYFHEIAGQKPGGPTVLFLFPPGQKVINAYRELSGRVVVLKDEYEPSSLLDQEMLRRMFREINPHYLATFVNDRIDEELVSKEVTPNLKGITHMGLGINNFTQEALQVAADRGIKIPYVGGGEYNVLEKATGEMAAALALTGWFDLVRLTEPVTETTEPDRILGPLFRWYLPAYPPERYPQVREQVADLMWAQLLRQARRIDEGVQLAWDDRFRGAGNGELRSVKGHQISGDPKLGIKTGLGLIGSDPFIERWVEWAKAFEVFRVFYCGRRRIDLEKAFNSEYSRLIHVSSPIRAAELSDYTLLSPDRIKATSPKNWKRISAERDYSWLIDLDRLALKQGLPIEQRGSFVYYPSPIGRIMGFIGLGPVGSRALQFLQPFAGRLLGVQHSSKDHYARLEQQFNIEYVDLDTLLRKSDIVVCAVPGSGSAEGLISVNRLNQLGFSVIRRQLFVNVGRGQLFGKTVEDESLVADYLRQHPRTQLATDVLLKETLPVGRQPLLRQDLRGQVTVTAHIASNVEGPRGGPSVRVDGMGMVMFENFKAMVNGEKLPNPVELHAAGLEEIALSPVVSARSLVVLTPDTLGVLPALAELGRSAPLQVAVIVDTAAQEAWIRAGLEEAGGALALRGMINLSGTGQTLADAIVMFQVEAWAEDIQVYVLRNWEQLRRLGRFLGIPTVSFRSWLIWVQRRIEQAA